MNSQESYGYHMRTGCFSSFHQLSTAAFAVALHKTDKQSVLNYLEGFKNGIVNETFYDVISHHKFLAIL